MEAVAALAKYNIGALVVAGPDMTIKGILSERDIVRALGRSGAGS
jgi:CBS domain-containing protein